MTTPATFNSGLVPASSCQLEDSSVSPQTSARQSSSNTSLDSVDSYYDALSDAPWAPAESSGSTALTAPSITSVAASPTLQEDAIALRKFALDLVIASGTEGGQAPKAAAIRTALAKHPEVLLWVVSGRDLNEIIAAADLPSLPEADNAVVSALPAIYSAATTAFKAHKKLKKLLRTVKDAQQFYETYDQEGLVAAAGEYTKKYAIKTLRKMGRKALIGLVTRLAREQALELFNGMTVETRENVLSVVPDAVFAAIADKIDDAIVSAKVSDSPEVKMMLDPNEGFDLASVPPAFREFFENVLTQYFDKLPIVDKRRIAIGLLELPPGSAEEEKLAAILNNSGPALQKLFQLFGDDVKSEKVAKVMAALKSQIKPFPGAQAVSIVEQELGGSITELFESFRENPVAAASVGQVHFASLKETGEDVIVKIMRPGLRERAAREMALLKELAPSGGTRKIVDRLESSLLEELDFTLEAKNMEYGEVYWSFQKGIFPVGLAGDFETTKDVLVMERAYKSPINEFHGKDLPAKSEALGTFMEMWYDNAVFGNGFFHGDLHAGNIFLNPEVAKTGSAYETRNYQLSLIDFGACGRLSGQEQRQIISFILGAVTHDSQIVVSALRELCDIGADEASALEAHAKTVFESGTKDSDACNQIINKAIELEVGLPKNFILYNRGRAFLENQIRDTNAELDQWDSAGKVPRVDPEKVFRDLMIWRLGQDLFKTVLSLQSSSTAKLDFGTIRSIVANNLPAVDEEAIADYEAAYLWEY
jgi:predicted unusual protein kinase regulating ubiquinone biosynthesis (AarF/ABC1/UbiB family)